VVSGVLKECIALIFKGKAVKKNVIACKTCSANETTVFTSASIGLRYSMTVLFQDSIDLPAMIRVL
jgi:hypothetical protein